MFGFGRIVYTHTDTHSHTGLISSHLFLFPTHQVMVEAYRRDAGSKEKLISELKSTKKRLVSEVKGLKQELLEAQGQKQKAELEQSRLQTEVVRVSQQMNSLENHLQSVQTERDQLETQIQVHNASLEALGFF